MTSKNFEDFLKDKHAEDYHGTDDNMPDAFDAWLTDDLQIDDLIYYADEYAKLVAIKIREEMLKSFQPMVDLLEDIKEAVVPPSPHEL